MGHWIDWVMANDAWFWIGVVGQLVFGARFIIQWITSEAEGRSVIPIAFWYCSILGGAVTLVYTIHAQTWPLVMGQAAPLGIYIRNLYLVYRERARTKAEMASS